MDPNLTGWLQHEQATQADGGVVVSEPRYWQRLLGEFVVIVVGVLVALAVDEWRSTRSDRALEQQYLERLEGDLTRTRSALDTARLQFAGAAHNADFVEPFLWGRTGLPGDTSTVVAALYRASRSLAPDLANTLPRTTILELQNTGRIGLIRSVPIRTAVQEYYTEVNTLSMNLTLLPGDYRAFIRSQIPPDLQATIRSECPVYATADSGDLECRIPLRGFDAHRLLREVAGNRVVAGDLNLSRQQLGIGVELLDLLLARTDSVQALLADWDR